MVNDIENRRFGKMVVFHSELSVTRGYKVINDNYTLIYPQFFLRFFNMMELSIWDIAITS